MDFMGYDEAVRVTGKSAEGDTVQNLQSWRLEKLWVNLSVMAYWWAE
jgi:hypothetical protein